MTIRAADEEQESCDEGLPGGPCSLAVFKFFLYFLVPVVFKIILCFNNWPSAFYLLSKKAKLRSLAIV